MFDKNEIAATLLRERSSCIIGEVHILMLKGQLISLFAILNFSKKTNENTPPRPSEISEKNWST